MQAPESPRLSATLLVILGLGLVSLLTVGGLFLVDQYVDGRGGPGQASPVTAGEPAPGSEDSHGQVPSDSVTPEPADEQPSSQEEPTEPSEIEQLPAVDTPEFLMPSGNVACVGQHGTVTCTIADKNYDFPGEADCEFGMGAELTEETKFLCLDESWSNLLSNPDAPVLGYGEQAAFGPITCYSRDTGINCVNANGAGFTLRRSDYTIN